MGVNVDVDDDRRNQIIQLLLRSCKEGCDLKPKYGLMGELAVQFQVSMRSIRRFWTAAKVQHKLNVVINVSSIRKHVIRKKKHVINYPQIEAIEVEKRGTIQAMSDALKISRATVGRWNTAHLLRPHTSSIRSLLTAPNMLVRLRFSLQAIHLNVQQNYLRFKPMENTVHIDEKWFYLTRNTAKYYLTPMEKNPHRVCKSKNFIPKVMFMCAVSRPVFGEDGNCLFDGKIGIWPFIEEVTAKRDSIHRKRGTKELKPMQNINRQVIRDCIVNQVIKQFMLIIVTFYF